MLEEARREVAEAEFILSYIEERKEELEELSKNPLSDVKDWESRDGREIRAALIRIDDDELVLRRNNGRYVQVGPSMLSEDSILMARDLVEIAEVESVFRELDPISSRWAWRIDQEEIEGKLVAVTDRYVVFRPLAGRHVVLREGVTGLGFGGYEMRLKSELETMENFHRVMKPMAGEPMMFQIVESLSTESFSALLDYGRGIYEARLEGTPVILVTNETAFITGGMAEMHVTFVDEISVLTKADREMWVPVLRESSRDAVEDFEKLENEIEELRGFIEAINDNRRELTRIGRLPDSMFAEVTTVEIPGISDPFRLDGDPDVPE